MKKTFLFLAGFMLFACTGLNPACAQDAAAAKPEAAPAKNAMTKAQLEERAKGGDIEAAVELGIFYEEEEDNPREAAEWFEAAAGAGNVRAMHRIGLLYRWGKGVPTNGRKAEEWFLKAANQNYGPAQSALGEIYMDGYVLPMNEAASVKWYTAAAEHGDPIGEYFIGMKYMQGDTYNAQDYRQAAVWLTKSADQNYAPAQANLGILYQYGYGVAQDGQKAYQLFLKSAEQGDMNGQYYAGMTLLNQRDPAYYPQGFQFIHDAAYQGYVPAMRLLPDLYQLGKGTPQSAVGAYMWLMIMKELTPTTEKQAIAQIKNKMHALGKYASNKDLAQAKASAEKWIGEYKNRIHYR